MRAELLADHDAVDGLAAPPRCLADDDALAGRQAVGLDDDRVIAGLDVGAGRVGVVEDLELGGGHVGVPHELLGEDLARLDAGRPSFERAEDLEALPAGR